VTECVLTDRMKTVLIDETGGELHFNQKFPEFAAYSPKRTCRTAIFRSRSWRAKPMSGRPARRRREM
jgi:hypothetical protein